MITQANAGDVPAVAKLAIKTRQHMQSIGLQQWPGNYPDQNRFQDDYEQNALFLYLEDDKILGSISLLPDHETAYREIQWLKDHSLVIHRLIVDPDCQRQGIGQMLFAFAMSKAKEDGYASIKVDTHPDNVRMQALIKKMGFIDVGYLSGINRLAYEYVL